ncbi:MAG: DUF4124 domain-containing protein, partial [Burkholderiales bacterium]|nr:DUF4124 domain-containing protein [Burkholderiales bacterium]
MDVPRIGSTLLLPLLLVAGGWAAAQQVYKHVMPDGRVIYSDQPIKGADKTKTVDVPPPPSEAERAAAAQRAQQQNKARDDLQERLDQRRKTLDEADAAVQAARRDLADAEA